MFCLLLGSGDIPDAQTLREKYLPLLKEEYDEELKSKLRGRKVVVLSDETTNRKGEAVLLTLFKTLPSKDDPECHLFVASVKVLPTTNADECSKVILQVSVSVWFLQILR